MPAIERRTRVDVYAATLHHFGAAPATYGLIIAFAFQLGQDALSDAYGNGMMMGSGMSVLLSPRALARQICTTLLARSATAGLIDA
jgi:hypothetical protein